MKLRKNKIKDREPTSLVEQNSDDENTSDNSLVAQSGETKEISPLHNKKENRRLLLLVFVSFLVFLPLFFPWSALIRSSLTKFAYGVSLDYDRIKLGVFTSDQISGLAVILGDQTKISVETLFSNIKKLSLLNKNLIGTAEFENVYFSSRGYTFSSPYIEMKSDLTGTDALFRSDGQSFPSGNFQIRGRDLSIDEVSSSLALPIKSDRFLFRSFNIRLIFEDNHAIFNGTSFESSPLDITAEGSITFQKRESALLNGKLCMKGNAGLEKEAPDIYGFYTMGGGKIGTPLCFKIGGTAQSPTFVPDSAFH